MTKLQLLRTLFAAGIVMDMALAASRAPVRPRPRRAGHHHDRRRGGARAPPTTPARWHGLDEVGELAPGRWADLCLVDDAGVLHGVMRHGEWIVEPTGL